MVFKSKNVNLAIIAICGALGILGGILASFNKFNYDFDQFFPDSDEQTEFYYEHRDRFQDSNELLLIGLVPERSIFDSAYLVRCREFSDALRRDTAITSVRDLPTASYYVRDKFMGSLFEVNYIHFDSTYDLEQDSAKIFSHPLLVGNLLDSNAQSLAIHVEHDKDILQEDADVLLQRIEHLADSMRLGVVHISGRMVGHNFYVKLTQRELILFVGSSVALIILFLWLTFRSWYGIVIPAVIVALGVVMTMGGMQLMGLEMNLVLNIIPTILMVVGISGVVHLFTKYLEELRKGKPKLEALKASFGYLSRALVLTSLTTIIGFMTFTMSDIKPIVDFGLVTSLGVAINLGLALLLLPAILYFMPSFLEMTPSLQRHTWKNWLEKLHGWTLKNRRGILLLSVILAVVSVIGTLRIRSNNYVLEDLKGDSPLKQSSIFFEEKYSGARPFEMAIEVLDTAYDILSPEVMTDIDTVESYLAEHYSVKNISSPTTPFKMGHMAFEMGDPQAFSLPDTGRMYKKVRRELKRNKHREGIGRFIANDLHHGRMMGTMIDTGSYYARSMNEDLHRFIVENTDTTRVRFQLTGAVHLMEVNNEHLSENVFMGLLIAFALIALIMALLFRDLTMLVISLIPNVLPLIMIAGIMGFAGIDLKVSTSLVFAIAFGIAVDDTIHFLSRFRYEMKTGQAKWLALKKTYLSTGKAIIVTSFVLSGGFLTLAFSDFLGTFYIGFLTSLTLLFAVFSDLFLLPVLLSYFYKD